MKHFGKPVFSLLIRPMDYQTLFHETGKVFDFTGMEWHDKIDEEQ